MGQEGGWRPKAEGPPRVLCRDARKKFLWGGELHWEKEVRLGGEGIELSYLSPTKGQEERADQEKGEGTRRRRGKRPPGWGGERWPKNNKKIVKVLSKKKG